MLRTEIQVVMMSQRTEKLTGPRSFISAPEGLLGPENRLCSRVTTTQETTTTGDMWTWHCYQHGHRARVLLLLFLLFSLCGGAVVQLQQLSDESFSELRSAVAFHGVSVRHLVEDVSVVDGDADAQPEDLLPRLVGFMEDKVSAGGKQL